jgi:hypothetical protein
MDVLWVSYIFELLPCRRVQRGRSQALILGDGHLRKDAHMTSEWNTNFGDYKVITRPGGRLCWEVIRSKRGYAALPIANADGFLDL